MDSVEGVITAVRGRALQNVNVRDKRDHLGSLHTMRSPQASFQVDLLSTLPICRKARGSLMAENKASRPLMRMPLCLTENHTHCVYASPTAIIKKPLTRNANVRPNLKIHSWL